MIGELANKATKQPVGKRDGHRGVFHVLSVGSAHRTAWSLLPSR